MKLVLMKLMKKPTLIGGVIVLAMAVGGMLSGLFRGFGPGGPGNGPQLNSHGDRPAETREAEDRQRPEPPEPAEEVSPDADAPPLQPPEVLDVVIDGRSYLIRRSVDGEEEFLPIELPELVELAKEAPGNEYGIRVRISRRGSSVPTAEQALDRALHDAGLSQTEIFRERELLP